MTNVDYPRTARGAALGARLRRSSAAIDSDATRVYETLGIPFEQRWFGVLDALSQEETLTVNELAAFLGISHAAVSQTRQSLEQNGLIISLTDPADARRRKLGLSEVGYKLVKQLRPVWIALADVALDLDNEAGEITRRLDQLDAALARKSLYERVMLRLNEQGLTQGFGTGSEN